MLRSRMCISVVSVLRIINSIDSRSTRRSSVRRRILNIRRMCRHMYIVFVVVFVISIVMRIRCSRAPRVRTMMCVHSIRHTLINRIIMNRHSLSMTSIRRRARRSGIACVCVFVSVCCCFAIRVACVCCAVFDFVV